MLIVRTYMVWRLIAYLHCMTSHYRHIMYGVTLGSYIVRRQSSEREQSAL